jgi:sensor histidine kinase YesM
MKTIIEAATIFPDMIVTDFDILIDLVYPVVILSGILLTAFLLYKFSLSRRKEVLLSFIIFSIISYPLIAMRYYIVAMIIAALVIVIYTVYKKMDGSILSLAGIIGFGLFTYLGYREIISYGYFAGVIFFIFCIMISLARQIAGQNLLHNQAVIRASRLESQLLKKNIQPHFILNSLTSLQELVEKSPGKAVELIDSLAEEFRVMSKISGEKLIPISEELEICNAHLRIMEFRRESKFKIDTKNINGDEMVPPAMFHTLVENGLTHGYGEKNNGYFLLTKENMDDGIRYKFFNDSESSDKIKNDKKGTGIKYIEARLEESYPGCWKFEQYSVYNGWQAVVEIYNSKRNN